ncbi:MAG: hypothetical protein LBQ22_01870 [Bacteroidales bacterium]|jgi:hypothetical protein|nr:hypothetical protein [Bacteroidales bacterium]
MYRFNLKRFILFLLPVSLRGNILNFITALCSPFSDVYSEFLEFRDKQFKILSYNSQYPNLQRLLNDEHDPEQRRIKVHDGEYLDHLVVYPSGENEPLLILNPGHENGIIVIHKYTAYEYPNPVMELPAEFENNTDCLARIDRGVSFYKFSGIEFDKIYVD